MNYASLKAAMYPHLMKKPIGELSLCRECKEFYESSYTFYCPQSEGQESDDAQCPNADCVEARDGRQ